MLNLSAAIRFMILCKRRTVLWFFLVIVVPLPSQALEVTVVAWNVYSDEHSGTYRYPELIDAIVKIDADIVCLQEVTSSFATMPVF